MFYATCRSAPPSRSLMFVKTTRPLGLVVLVIGLLFAPTTAHARPLPAYKDCTAIAVPPGKTICVGATFDSDWENGVYLYHHRSGKLLTAFNPGYHTPGSWSWRNDSNEPAIILIAGFNKGGPFGNPGGWVLSARKILHTTETAVQIGYEDKKGEDGHFRAVVIDVNVE